MESLRELIEIAGRNYGKKTFCIFYDGTRIEEITYEIFNARVNQTGRLFWDFGITKGDKVALYLPNSLEYLYCWFGLAKIGALMVPINYSFMASEAKYILDHSESKIVVTDSKKIQQVNEIRDRCTYLERIGVVDSMGVTADFYLNRDLVKYPSDLPEVDIQINDEASILNPLYLGNYSRAQRMRLRPGILPPYRGSLCRENGNYRADNSFDPAAFIPYERPDNLCDWSASSWRYLNSFGSLPSIDLVGHDSKI